MSSTHALGCLHRIARPGLSLDSHTVTSKRHQYACVPHVARLLLDLLELWPFAEGRALRAVVRWCVEVEQLARGSAQYLYPKALRTPTRHANGEIRPAAIQPTTEPWQSERTRETERGGGGLLWQILRRLSVKELIDLRLRVGNGVDGLPRALRVRQAEPLAQVHVLHHCWRGREVGKRSSGNIYVSWVTWHHACAPCTQAPHPSRSGPQYTNDNLSVDKSDSCMLRMSAGNDALPADNGGVTYLRSHPSPP